MDTLKISNMNRCSYTWEERFMGKLDHIVEQCTEETWRGSEKYCIFHDPDQEKDMKLLKQKLREKLDKRDYNFKGYCFPEANFDNFIFEENADFSEAIFQNVHSWGVIFQNVRFMGAIFENADFLGATFGIVDFCEATFRKYVLFEGATFQNAYFNGATFQNAYFNGATFQYANFRGATFQNTDFLGATFQNAYFNGAIFEKNFRFAPKQIRYPMENPTLFGILWKILHYYNKSKVLYISALSHSLLLDWEIFTLKTIGEEP